MIQADLDKGVFSVKTNIKTVGATGPRLFAILMGWCLLMTIYFSVYDLLERNSVPVAVGSKDFETTNWDKGYFSASGSLANENAVTPCDELVLGTSKIRCVRDTKTCTISTATVYSGVLGLDISDYDIKEWSNRFIYFDDKSSICAEQYYVVDRVTQAFSYLSKRKDVIPDYALKSPLKPCASVTTAPKQQGGGDMRSRTTDCHALRIMAAYEAAPDGTLAELRAALAEDGISLAVATLWRFFRRRRITRKKRPATRPSRTAPMCSSAAARGSAHRPISIPGA